MRRVARSLVVALLLSLLPASTASAETYGSWRRWPWRNGYLERITQVGGHSYASKSAAKAIDIALDYEMVHSVGPGSVVRASNSKGAGNYVQIEGDDGSVYTYEHLSRFETAIGDRIFIGDAIAVSGNSGNSTGPHLHLQRSETTSFSSDAMTLLPLDGVYEVSAGSDQRSGNAGIGTDSGSRRDSRIRARYRALGGWSALGVPQALPSSLTPCWTEGRAPTRWMYRCDGSLLQTFQRGADNTILIASGDDAFAVGGGFERVLTARHPSGGENLHALGAPIAALSAGSGYSTQRFENGYLWRETGACSTLVAVDGEPHRWVTSC